MRSKGQEILFLKCGFFRFVHSAQPSFCHTFLSLLILFTTVAHPSFPTPFLDEVPFSYPSQAPYPPFNLGYFSSFTPFYLSVYVTPFNYDSTNTFTTGTGHRFLGLIFNLVQIGDAAEFSPQSR